MTKEIESKDVVKEKKEATVAEEKKTVKPAAKKEEAVKTEEKKETKPVAKKADTTKTEEVKEVKPATKKVEAAKTEEKKEVKPAAKKADTDKAEDVKPAAKAEEKEAPVKKADSKKDNAEGTEEKTFERKPRAPYQKSERTFSRSGGNFYRQRSRRRVCSFCANKVDEIDYIKLAAEINKGYDPHSKEDQRPRYITEKGRILPRRMSGVCVKHQRALATAVKRARIMGLLPFSAD
jgi:small subunit ribosomal protein S18